MITDVYYVDKEDAKCQADRLRIEWSFGILEMIGFDITDFIPEDGDVMSRSVEHLSALRKVLKKEKIFFDDLRDGSLDIYVQGNLIAQWQRPKFKRHLNPFEKDPAKKDFVSIEINHWSVYDNEE